MEVVSKPAVKKTIKYSINKFKHILHLLVTFRKYKLNKQVETWYLILNSFTFGKYSNYLVILIYILSGQLPASY